MAHPEALASWRDGTTRSAILDFVRSVTRRGDSFAPPAERVATFDNDGTLWCEKPMYVQADFIMRRWKEMIQAQPELAKTQPFKALAAGDREWLMDLYAHVPELIKGVTEAYEGITVEAFEAAVDDFFKAARHPTLGVPYSEVAYRPMRELLAFLAANDFAVYLCSAGGRDFVRPVSEQIYGIPRERVIGSATTLEYRDGELYRTAGVEQPIDDGPGKPVPHLDPHGTQAAAGRRQRRRRRPDAGDRALRAPCPSRRRGARVRLRRGRRESARGSQRPRLDGGQHEGRLRHGVLRGGTPT